MAMSGIPGDVSGPASRCYEYVCPPPWHALLRWLPGGSVANSRSHSVTVGRWWQS